MEEEKDVPDWVQHPGFDWLRDAKCHKLFYSEENGVDAEAISKFFVEAGYVISDEVKNICKTCPVRRECLIHSFTGNRGRMIMAGYFAGFSYGQRKSKKFDVLYNIVESESLQYRTRK